MLKVEIAVGGEATTFAEVPESELAITTDLTRRRLTVSKDTECVTFRFTQTVASDKTEIYGLQYDVRSYQPDAEGQ